MPSLPTQALYAASQTARVGFFLANRYLSNRLSGPVVKVDDIAEGLPTIADLLADIRRLFAADWANIEAGTYPPPDDMLVRPSAVFGQVARYFADLPAIHRRRATDAHQEALREAEAQGVASRFPRYYLQNFHYQSDGWLSERSARRYDFQVEVLFLGAADAMRRQALVPAVDAVRRAGRRRVTAVDLACGTGRFLAALRGALPGARLTGVDLSPSYVAEARRHLRRRRRVVLREGALEALPLATASQDIATCVFTYHELPKKVRAIAAGEVARILAPGGRYIHVDTLQSGDHTPYDGLLRLFPKAFHEPYFADYVGCDIVKLFAEAGLVHISDSRAFLSKVSVFEKPA